MRPPIKFVKREPHHMTEPKVLPAMCPNGHFVVVGFSVDDLRASQAADGTLEFHCPRCDTNWKPTAEEIAYLRRYLEKYSY